MFAKFRLKKRTLSDYLKWLKDTYDLDTDKWTYNVEEESRQFYQSLLDTVWIDKTKGELDGERLKRYVFPYRIRQLAS